MDQVSLIDSRIEDLLSQYQEKRMNLTKGILIVFEGIDGSGKTTQAQYLKTRLEEMDIEVVCFREPSESRWGREIKAKAAIPDSLTAEEELALFQRDREENVDTNLRPALDRKKVVILDRYYYSTIAYQGAKGIDKERIRRLNERFVIQPDLVFVLDVRAGKGLQRISERQNKDLLFEREEYLVEVRKNFKALSGENVVHIDGEESEDVISNRIARIVINYMKKYMADD
jgi:dTMP kinase